MQICDLNSFLQTRVKSSTIPAMYISFFVLRPFTRMVSREPPPPVTFHLIHPSSSLRWVELGVGCCVALEHCLNSSFITYTSLLDSPPLLNKSRLQTLTHLNYQKFTFTCCCVSILLSRCKPRLCQLHSCCRHRRRQHGLQSAGQYTFHSIIDWNLYIYLYFKFNLLFG